MTSNRLFSNTAQMTIGNAHGVTAKRVVPTGVDVETFRRPRVGVLTGGIYPRRPVGETFEKNPPGRFDSRADANRVRPPTRGDRVLRAIFVGSPRCGKRSGAANRNPDSSPFGYEGKWSRRRNDDDDASSKSWTIASAAVVLCRSNATTTIRHDSRPFC